MAPSTSLPNLSLFSVLLTASVVFSSVRPQSPYLYQPEMRKYGHQVEKRQAEKQNQQLSQTKIRLIQSLSNNKPLRTLNFQRNISEFLWQLDQSYFKHGVYPRNTRRLQKVLRKALDKKPVNLLIIGGSNSAGGGIDRREGNIESTYYGIFTRWWRRTIAPITGSDIKVFNIAIGGTGGALFAYCFDAFIPVNQLIDIVLVEQSVNYKLPGKAKPLEQLTRRLLRYFSAPDVLYVNAVGSFSGQSNPECVNLEDLGQTELAEHYQITSFSLRDIICPMVGGQRVKNSDMASKMSSRDSNHISIKAHAHIGTLLINYIRKVFLAQIQNNQFTTAVPRLPEPLLLDNPLEIITNPKCSTSVTPNYKQDFYHRTLNLKPLSIQGFTFIVKRYLNFDKNTDYQEMARMDRQRGWVGSGPGATIKYGVLVPPWRTGTEEVQSRSVSLIIHFESEGSKGLVFLDQQRDTGITVNAKEVRSTNDVYTIATRVPPGYHTITIEVLSEGKLMITGLVVGPPEFCCHFL